jgi:hypothetical protein
MLQNKNTKYNTNFFISSNPDNLTVSAVTQNLIY